MNEPQLRGVSNAVDNEKKLEKVADEAPPSQPLDVKEVPTANQVTCDSNPCNGFFSYSPPNTDNENASATFQYTFDRYKYGYGGEKVPDGKQNEIFMPRNVGEACAIEWKEARKNWTER